MATATATVSYRAELSNLRAQLASYDDITRAQATKLVRDVDRSMRAAEKAHERVINASKAYSVATRQAATASTGLKNAARSVAIQLPDVASQLAAGTPPAQVFAQQGLQVVQSNMDSLMRLMSRFAPHMGAIGLAAATAAAAYVVLARDLEIAEAKMSAASDAATAAQTRHAGLTTAIEAVDVALAKADGSYDDLAAAQQERDDAIRASVDAERRAVEADYQRAKSEHDSALATRESAKINHEKYDANKRLAETTEALAAAEQTRTTRLAALSDKEAEALHKSSEVVRVTRERKAAEDALADAARRRADAAREAEREEARLEAEKRRRLHDQMVATEALQALSRQMAFEQLSGQERIAESYYRQIEAIDALEVRSQNHAEAEQARQLATQAYDRETTQYRAQLSDSLRQRQIQNERMVAQVQQQTANNWMQATQVATAALASSFEQGSAAAQAFYVVSQGVAAASALVQGRVAAMAALAPPPLGLGPVAGLPLSRSIRALGAAQAGAIMATTVAGFGDTPGVTRAGPGGMVAPFAPGDLVVAGRDEGDLVRQMQRAGIGGGGGSDVYIRDADRHHGRYGRDPMRAPDRYQPVRRRAGRVPGRR